MASGKKRRKSIAQDRKLSSASIGGPPRIRDGDRRRRPTHDPVRAELERKRHERDWTIDDPTIDWSVLSRADD